MDEGESDTGSSMVYIQAHSESNFFGAIAVGGTSIFEEVHVDAFSCGFK